MALVLTGRAPNREIYEKVSANLNAGDRPDGLVVHTASETPQGDVLIVDVWETREAAEAYRSDIQASFEANGMGELFLDGPQPEMYDTFDVR